MWKKDLPVHILEESRESYVTRKHSKLHEELQGSSMDCALGTNPLGTSPKIMRYLEMPQHWDLSSYPPPEARELQEKLGKYLGKDVLNPEDIVFGQGSINVLLTLLRILLPPGSTMGGISPQFTDVPLQMSLGQVLYAPEHLSFPRMSFDLSVLEQNLSRQIKVLYIDRPHNPTGQTLPLKDLETLCLLAEERHVWVLVDEAYADYLPPEEGAHNLQNENLLVTRSFSKCWGLAGIRAGYGIIRDKELRTIYRKLHPPFALSTPAIAVALKALSHPEFLDATRTYVLEAKKNMLEAVKDNPLLTPGDTDLRVPIMALHFQEGNLWEALACRGISSEPGEGYMHTDNRSVRLRVPPPDNLSSVLSILREVKP